MQARIYFPTKSSMQSGNKNIKKWVLKFESTGKSREKMMDWISSTNTKSQLALYFDSAEEAIKYASKHHINYIITYPNEKVRIIKSYADNFNE